MGGWVVLAPFALAAAVHGYGMEGSVATVAVHALTPFLYLPVWVLLVFAVRHASWWLAAGSALIVAAHLVWVVPSFVADAGRPAGEAGGDTLRVLTANLFAGNDRLDALAEQLGDVDADVLVLQEFTPAHARALERAGVMGRYPHTLLRPRRDAYGAAILSSRPLAATAVLDVAGMPLLRATIDVGSWRAVLYNVHPESPNNSTGIDQWLAQYEELTAILGRRVEEGRPPVIVAGDLNATHHHPVVRRLLDLGLREAHLVRGRGWTPTFPVDAGMLPPFMRLDHVLTSDELAVLGVGRVDVPGSDHLAVEADLGQPGR